MGTSLYLYVDDESIESPQLSRKFMDEIIFEWYIKFETFLQAAEIKVISPNILGEITLGEKKPFREKDKSGILEQITKALTGKGSLSSVNKLFDEFLITSTAVEDRERDPEELKSVLRKVHGYLVDHSSKLPVVHTLYTTPDHQDEVNIVLVDGVKATVDGDLFYLEDYHTIRNKIQVKSWHEDHGKIDLLLEATPEVQIGEKTYYCRTITKAVQFEEDFKSCYDFLDNAIQVNKNVLWEFD